MLPAIPFSHPHTHADLARLRLLLADGLRLAQFPAPNTPWTLLNLACGRADETAILWQLLAQHQPGRYLGVDLRLHEISQARTRWSNIPPGTEISFLHGDASILLSDPALNHPDFIFIRHQNFWHDPPAWHRLYHHALEKLAPHGLLAITSYFQQEHDLALASLASHGAVLLADLPHHHARPLADHPDKAVDRRLALLRRPDHPTT